MRRIAMYHFKKYFSVISCFTLFISTITSAQTSSQPVYYPQVYLSGYAFKNEPLTAGESILLAPLSQNADQLLFSSFRILDKSGKPWESNVALGYRCLNVDHMSLIGLYGGIDYLKTTRGVSFNEINFGAEAWCNNWFLGGNIYRPYGRKEYSAPNPQSFSFQKRGGYRNIGFTETKEQALPGVDAEIGHTLVDGLTVYAGGYYFHDNNTKALSGPKARAEYIVYAKPNHKLLGLFDRVAVEGLVTNDAVRGINYYGGLTVGISWGANNANLNLKGVERHMVDPIRRDVDVVTKNNVQPVNLPVNICDVDTLDGFNQAISDSKTDVIAIHGTINGVSDAAIDRNLYITGNTYQFVHNKQPIIVTLSKYGELIGAPVNTNGEHGLLHVKGSGSIVTIRDLILSTDKTAPTAIFHTINDGSMGILNIESILANGNISIAVSGKNTRAFIDHITNSSIGADGTTALNNSSIAKPFNSHGALSFSAENGAELSIGKISNNKIGTHGFDSPGMFFEEINGNILIGNIYANSIDISDARSPGLTFFANGGNITLQRITHNSIDTDSAFGMFFSTESAGKLNINEISNNEIKMARIPTVENYPSIVSGITFLSEENANINIGNVNNNKIFIDCESPEDDLFFGINIDANGGNISGKEMNGNQIMLANSTNDSWGFGLQQWYNTKPNFIKLESIMFNKITIAGDNGGDGFDLITKSPANGIIIKSLNKNIVTQDNFYSVSE